MTTVRNASDASAPQAATQTESSRARIRQDKFSTLHLPCFTAPVKLPPKN